MAIQLVSINCTEIRSSWTTIMFSRVNLLHAASYFLTVNKTVPTELFVLLRFNTLE